MFRFIFGPIPLSLLLGSKVVRPVGKISCKIASRSYKNSRTLDGIASQEGKIQRKISPLGESLRNISNRNNSGEPDLPGYGITLHPGLRRLLLSIQRQI